MKKIIVTIMCCLSLAGSACGVIQKDESASVQFESLLGYLNTSYNADVVPHNEKCDQLVKQCTQALDESKTDEVIMILDGDENKKLLTNGSSEFLGFFLSKDPFKKIFEHACNCNNVVVVNKMIDMKPRRAENAITLELAKSLAGKGHVDVLKILFDRLNAYDAIRYEQVNSRWSNSSKFGIIARLAGAQERNYSPMKDLEAIALENNKHAVIKVLSSHLRREIWWDNGFKDPLKIVGALAALSLMGGVANYLKCGAFSGC